jgi:outer membrane protein OmpA-like peptidoglycan-associated protein
MNTELSASKIISIFTCPGCGIRFRFSSDAEKIIVTCKNCKRRYVLERNKYSYEIASKKKERKELEWEGEDSAGLLTLIGMFATGNPDARKELRRKITTDKSGKIHVHISKRSKLYPIIGRIGLYIVLILFLLFVGASYFLPIQYLQKRLLEKQKEILHASWRDVTISGSTLKLSDKSSVFFDFDNYLLKNTAKNKLNLLSNVLSSRNKVLVFGYTDSAGDSDYNQSLSYKRALSVRDYIISIRPKTFDIRVEGFGESESILDHNPFDRRVDIFITTGETDKSLINKLRDSDLFFIVTSLIGFLSSVLTILTFFVPIERRGTILLKKIFLNNL